MTLAVAAMFDSSRRVSSTGRAADALLFVVFLSVLLFRFVQPNDEYLPYFTDDFFYYFEVARNLVDGGVSTFDGTIPTNGYHPLWLLVIAAHYLAFGDTPAFFVVFTTTISLLCWGAYLLFRSIAAAVTGEAVASRLIALYAACFLLVLSRTGMEVSLAVFLGAIAVRRLQKLPFAGQSDGQLASTGLIASLMVLARIDSAILVVFLLLLQAALGRDPLRAFVRRVVPFAAGAVLVPIYVAVNVVVFETLIPISGMAKQLKTTLMPSFRPVERFVEPSALSVLFTWPCLALILASSALLIAKREARPSRDQTVVVLSVVATPFFYYTLLCFLSDWPIWTWYFYPLVLPLVALVPYAARFVLPALLSRPRSARLIAFGVLATMMVALGGLLPRNPDAFSIYQGAQRIAAWSAANPGRLAMGDRAGTPAYYVEAPLVQLEGLVEDRHFLENIRRGRNLLEVLREMKIDYYVATNPVRTGDCLRASEPRMSGPRQPKMVGIFCDVPVAQFTYGGYRTYIFKVQ